MATQRIEIQEHQANMLEQLGYRIERKVYAHIPPADAQHSLLPNTPTDSPPKKSRRTLKDPRRCRNPVLRFVELPADQVPTNYLAKWYQLAWECYAQQDMLPFRRKALEKNMWQRCGEGKEYSMSPRVSGLLDIGALAIVADVED